MQDQLIKGTMKSAVLNVVYPDESYPPWRFSCAQDGDRFDRSAGCVFPGAEIEAMNFVFRQLNATHVNRTLMTNLTINDAALFTGTGLEYTLVASLLPVDVFEQYNLTMTQPVICERLTILMSSRPVGVSANYQSVFAPFHWTLWLTACALVAANIAYSFSLRHSPSSLIRRLLSYRASIGTSLLPVSFGLMLLMNLYQSGLLAKLLTVKKTYLLNDVSELIDLDDDVLVYAMPEQWTGLVKQFSLDEQVALLQRPVIAHNYVLNATIARQLIDKTAVYVGLETDMAYQERECEGALRHLIADGGASAVCYGLGLLEDTQRELLDQLNDIISHSSPAVRSITARYQNMVAEPNGCPQVPHPNANAHSLGMPSFGGLFLLLTAGFTTAILQLLMESLPRAVVPKT